MWIAVAATGPTQDSLISASFIEASCFILVDVDSGQYHAFANPNAYDPEIDDFPIVQCLSGAGVCVVLLQDCAPEIQRTLQERGIRVYTHVEGVVSEAVEQFRQGGLHSVTMY